jgi:hypothetical protein
MLSTENQFILFYFIFLFIYFFYYGIHFDTHFPACYTLLPRVAVHTIVTLPLEREQCLTGTYFKMNLLGVKLIL